MSGKKRPDAAEAKIEFRELRKATDGQLQAELDRRAMAARRARLHVPLIDRLRGPGAISQQECESIADILERAMRCAARPACDGLDGEGELCSSSGCINRRALQELK